MTAVGTNALYRHAVIRILCFLALLAHSRQKQLLTVLVVRLGYQAAANPAQIQFRHVAKSVISFSPAAINVNSAVILDLVRHALFKSLPLADVGMTNALCLAIIKQKKSSDAIEYVKQCVIVVDTNVAKNAVLWPFKNHCWAKRASLDCWMQLLWKIQLAFIFVR